MHGGALARYFYREVTIMVLRKGTRDSAIRVYVCVCDTDIDRYETAISVIQYQRERDVTLSGYLVHKCSNKFGNW